VLTLLAAQAAAADIDARLRIAWGGGEARQWQGTIRLSEGTLSEVVPLGLEADAPGSMLLIDAACVRVFPRIPRSYDACDLRVQAPENARLIVQMWSGATPAAAAVEVPLATVLRGFSQFDLDDRQNRLFAQRSPGDALRVAFHRDSLVFGPEERFDLEVQPQLPDLTSGASYLLAAALEPARSDEQLWNKDLEVRVDSSGRAAATAVSVPLPAAEGVYDVRLFLYPKRLTTTLVRGKPLASRTVQVIVLAPVKTIDRQSVAWDNVFDFDPASPKWWERMAPRLPTWTLLPSIPQPVESGPAQTRAHLSRTLVELPPQGWQAYPLSVAAPGTPHILEVEYPSDVEQTLGISLVEPSAAGQVGPIGLDTGVDVPAPQSGHKAQLRRHRLICWPKTRTPYVLVVNRRDDRPALVGRVSLLAGPRELPPAKIPLPSFPSRLLAAYYDKPLFAENFSATGFVDPISRKDLDDWVTFHEAGQRLMQVLQHGGYNALVMTVACEGSAIYPSRLLSPTPKYDTGAFFESGQDVVRKDVLEMLMRLCDRNGIQLIPAVQFSGPLPELEARRLSGGAEAVGLEPLAPDGRTWMGQRKPPGGIGVYYNALDPRVQQAMQSVVGELAERYGHHACFGGIAVHLSTEQYSLLPDETCSYDDVTFARFLEETQLEMPLAATPLPPLAARERFLRGQAKEAWLKWRSQKLTQMYAQMQRDLAHRQTRGRLYLTTADLLGGRQIQLALRPTLPPNVDPAQLLPLVGLDVAGLLQEGIVVPRPQRIVSAAEPEARLLTDHWNHSAELDELFRRQGRGTALNTLEPASLPLPNFDAVSPLGADKTRTLLLPAIVPADAQQRKRFVQSLATLDAPLLFDGGWLLPLGQEAALAPLVQVFRRLPAEAFVTTRPAEALRRPPELVVRTLSKRGRTYLYVLNTSPWPLDAQIDLAAETATQWMPYCDARRADFQNAAGRQALKLELEPYDLIGGELSSDQAVVTGWKVVRPENATASLREQIHAARLRANWLREPPPLAVLQNPSFEAPSSDGTIPGWDTPRGANMRVEVDPTGGDASGSSLHLASYGAGGPGPVVCVRSEPFPPPKTGRLSLIASIRVADPARQPKLRLAIEGKQGGQVYYVKASVGAAEDGQPVKPLTGEWSRYRFPLNSLPIAGLSDLRVGFDLMGAGEVWIDNVEVYDLYFEDAERAELLRSFALAPIQLNAGELAEGHRFVESYWPGFLRRHVPLSGPAPAAPGPAPPLFPTPPIAARPKDNPPAPPPPVPQEPRAANSKKSWWPDWMRWR
jgi:hypothetical protein